MTNLSDFVFNSEFLFLEVGDGDIVWVWAVVFFVNRDFQGLMLRFQGLNLLLKVHERTLLTLMIVADHSGILIGSQPPKYGNSIRFKNLHSPRKNLASRRWCTLFGFDTIDFFGEHYGFVMEDIEELKARLTELKNEHRDLDEVIQDLTSSGPYDQIKLQRLKKRKLQLKDQIALLEDGMLPDIIA